MGTGGVINIEREAKLSGPLHSKGFLVLSGYLGWMFARAEPLILSASVSFEQMYEEVEGDSASVAELYALMSAIGEVPLRQGIAVTGAVSEKGQVLPVGGVTEKIEGFFAACERVGLDGQGVILPRRNVDNLVLRREVRDAVEAGRFHIWAIDRIEEGWPILTGLEAGEARPDGTFPEGTVHHAVKAASRSGRRSGNASPIPRPGRERRRAPRGTASRALAWRVASELGVESAPRGRALPDGETSLVVDGGRGRDVFVVQATSPPVNDHLDRAARLRRRCRRGRPPHRRGRAVLRLRPFRSARRGRVPGDGLARG